MIPIKQPPWPFPAKRLPRPKKPTPQPKVPFINIEVPIEGVHPMLRNYCEWKEMGTDQLR